MTLSQQPILLSKKGIKELQKRITNLEQREKTVRARLRELERSIAREERLERAEVLSELEVVEDELQEQREILRQAKPIPTRRARLKVALGSAVDLIDQQGRLFRYTIVNSVEVNPSDGRISADSPLGSKLLGKRLQDTIELSTGRQTRSLQLVKIT